MSEAMTYKLPPLPKNLPNVVSRIRACEGDVAAQVVFEHALNKYAIAAIEAQGVPDGWQPIETAPKDVTFLLYGSKRLEMCVGMNHSRDGWVTDTTSEWASMYPPTHWMPLPTAPGASAPPAPQAEPAPAGSGGWEAHAKALEHELAYWKQRAQTMHEHQKGECWYWQGDGNDHPESMVNSLPVVIRADALRALMAPQASVVQEPVGWCAPRPDVVDWRSEEQIGGLSMFATSRECIANNGAARDCASAIRAMRKEQPNG